MGRADDADVAGAGQVVEDKAAAAARETPAGARRRSDPLRPPDGPLDVDARLRDEPLREGLELVVAGGAAGLAEREEDSCFAVCAADETTPGSPATRFQRDVKLQCRGQNDSGQPPRRFQRDALLMQ